MGKLNKQKITAGITKSKQTGKQQILNDGAGLELRLSGSNYGLGEWSLNSSFNGKRKRIHLGYYFHSDLEAGLSLDEARSVAFKVRVDIKNGTSIVKLGKHNVVTDKTVRVKDFYFNTFLPQQKGKSKALLTICKTTITFLENFGFLDLPMEDLSMQVVLPSLSQYKNTPSVVKKVCAVLSSMSATCAQIYDTPKRSFKPELITGKVETISYVGIPVERLDEWFTNLKEGRQKVEIKARLCLLLLTLNRAGEVAELSKDWIAEDKGCIIFPTTVMKARKEHLVPITPLVARILKLLKEPITRRRMSSCFDSTRPEKEYTIHGFRSMAATVLHQLCAGKGAIVERCLAHETKGQIEQVYNRYNYLDEMHQVKLVWEDHLIKNTKILDFIEYLKQEANQ